MKNHALLAVSYVRISHAIRTHFQFRIRALPSWGLVGLSAFLSAVSFLDPTRWAELQFVCYAPLFYLFLHDRLQWRHGLIYGFVFYILYGYGLLLLIFEHGYGKFKYSVGLGYLLYGALLAVIWFYLLTQFQKVRAPIILRLILAWVSALGYFYFIDSFFWLPCGARQGNTLQNILVPLTVRIEWLYCLRFVWQECIWFYILTVNGCLVMGKGVWRNGLFIFLSALGAIGWLAPRGKAANIFQISFQCVDKDYEDPWHAAEAIAQKIKGMGDSPVDLVVFPESSFPFPLNEYPEHIEDWQGLLPWGANLIIGSHRREGSALYNCVYHFHRRITHCYDKIFRMFLTEYVPRLFNKRIIRNLFLHNKDIFNKGKDTFIFSIKDKRVVPAICSEWYFNAHRLSIPADAIVLVVANDSWFSCVYVRELMQLTARLHALKLGHSMIYSSHYYGFYFNP